MTATTRTAPSSPAPRSIRPRPRRLAPSPALGVALYVGCPIVAVAASALLVSATGGDAGAVWSALVDGSVRSPGAWGLTLTTLAPLLLVAVGTIVSTKAGLVNIGQEGQLLIGACCAAYAAVRMPGPGALALAVALLAGAAGGGLWAGLAAGLRWWKGVPEVLSTLLLTFVAFPVATWALKQTWLVGDRDTGRVNRVNTGEQVPADTLLPDLVVAGNSIDGGALLALAAAVVVSVVLARTVLGFRIRTLGLNPRAAQRFGVPAGRFGAAALATSGAFAGLGGAVLLLGGAAGDRLTIGFSSNFGWDGLLVALLAGDSALLAMPMAFVFAALRTGSGFLAATGVDRKITDVVQALLVLALLVPPALLALRTRTAARSDRAW